MAIRTAPQQTPIRVSLRTERFRLTGLQPHILTQRYCDWLADPDVAGPLNRTAKAPSLQSLRAEISTANGVTRFYVGIFDPDDQPIGYYMLHRDPVHRTVSFNVLIGEKRWWGERVVLETRAALLDHFFAERGVDKAIGMPLARNFPAVFNYKRQGWRLEGVLKGQCLAFDGSSRLDQFQFGLSSEDWQEKRKAGQ